MKVKADLRTLDHAIERLYALTTPGDNRRCVVPDEHKEGVRLYVQTWIIPLIEGVRDDMAGKESLPYWIERL